MNHLPPLAFPAGDEVGGTSLLEMLAICATAELVDEEGSAAVQASTKTSPLKKKRVVASPAPRRGRPPQSSPLVRAKQPARPFFPPAAASPAPTNLMPPVAAKASEWDIAGMVPLERIKARKLPLISTFIAKERSKYLTDPDHIRIFLDYLQYALYEFEIEAVTPAQEEKVHEWKKGVRARYSKEGIYTFLENILIQLQKGASKARKFKSYCLELKTLLEEWLKHAAAATVVIDEEIEEVSETAVDAPAAGEKEVEENEEEQGGPLKLLPARCRLTFSSVARAEKALSPAHPATDVEVNALRAAGFDAVVNAPLMRTTLPSLLAPELRSLPFQQRINAVIIKATEVHMDGNILDNRCIAEAAAEMGGEISMEDDWGYLYALGGIVAFLVDSTTPRARRKKLLASWEEYTNLSSSKEIVDIFVGEVIAALLSPMSTLDSVDKKLAKELKRLGHSARLRIATQKRCGWLVGEDSYAETTVSTSAAASAAQQNIVDLTGEEEALSAEKWDPFKGLV